MGVEVKGAGDGVVIADEAVMIVITGIPVGAALKGTTTPAQ